MKYVVKIETHYKEHPRSRLMQTIDAYDGEDAQRLSELLGVDEMDHLPFTRKATPCIRVRTFGPLGDLTIPMDKIEAVGEEIHRALIEMAQDQKVTKIR